jgi:hypothetical protein
VVTVTVMVGIRANVGKPVDNITLQLVLPPSVASSDLTANHGSVLPNHSTRVLSTFSIFEFLHLGIWLSLNCDEVIRDSIALRYFALSITGLTVIARSFC